MLNNARKPKLLLSTLEATPQRRAKRSKNINADYFMLRLIMPSSLIIELSPLVDNHVLQKGLQMTGLVVPADPLRFRTHQLEHFLSFWTPVAD